MSVCWHHNKLKPWTQCCISHVYLCKTIFFSPNSVTDPRRAKQVEIRQKSPKTKCVHYHHTSGHYHHIFFFASGAYFFLFYFISINSQLWFTKIPNWKIRAKKPIPSLHFQQPAVVTGLDRGR